MIQEVFVEKFGENNYTVRLHFGDKLDGTLFQDQVFNNLTTEELLRKVAEFTGEAMHDSDLRTLDETPMIYFGFQAS